MLASNSSILHNILGPERERHPGKHLQQAQQEAEVCPGVDQEPLPTTSCSRQHQTKQAKPSLPNVEAPGGPLPQWCLPATPSHPHAGIAPPMRGSAPTCSSLAFRRARVGWKTPRMLPCGWQTRIQVSFFTCVNRTKNHYMHCFQSLKRQKTIRLR